METTPERKAYPVRGSIVNSTISLLNKSAFSSRRNSNNPNHRNSIVSNHSKHSDGASSFKPSMQKPGIHVGDVPGLGKKYDPLIRAARSPPKNHNPAQHLSNEFLSQNESLIKQIHDRQNQSLRYASNNYLSFQHNVVEMDISQSSAEKKHLNQTEMLEHPDPLSGFSSPHNDSRKQTQLVFSPSNLISPVSPNTGDASELTNPTDVLGERNTMQMRDMLVPSNDKEGAFFRNDLWTPAHRQIRNPGLAFATESLKRNPRDISNSSDNMLDVDEHPVNNSHAQRPVTGTPLGKSPDNDLVMDFRKIRHQEDFSDPYTLSHRQGGVEMAPSDYISCNTKNDMSYTSRLEREFEIYNKNV